MNRIAEREAHARRYYRPVYTMHNWWARWLGSVFRTIALYALTDEEALERPDVQTGSRDLLSFEKSKAEHLWDLSVTDAHVGAGKSCWMRRWGRTSIVERTAKRLEPAAEAIRDEIRGEKAVGSHETGARVNGQSWWQWTLVTDRSTYYVIACSCLQS